MTPVSHLDSKWYKLHLIFLHLLKSDFYFSLCSHSNKSSQYYKNPSFPKSKNSCWDSPFVNIFTLPVLRSPCCIFSFKAKMVSGKEQNHRRLHMKEETVNMTLANTFSKKNHITLQNQSRWTASNTNFPWNCLTGEPCKCEFILFTSQNLQFPYHLLFLPAIQDRNQWNNQKSHFKTLFLLILKYRHLFSWYRISPEFSEITFTLNNFFFL